MISLSKLERQRKKEKERRKKEKNPKVYSSEEKERKESRETRAENFKLFGVLSSRVEISMEEKKNSQAAPLLLVHALVGSGGPGKPGSGVAPRFFHF